MTEWYARISYSLQPQEHNIEATAKWQDLEIEATTLRHTEGKDSALCSWLPE